MRGMLGTLWTIVCWPFRVIGWVVEMLGRLAGLGVGFALMVVGVALGSGSYLPLGIPVFVVGLVLLLRSLG